MLFKTDGIVLNISIYDDKKSFVHIFTEDFGLVSYSIPNTHSKRSKLRRSLFTPFTILEMDVTHHPDRSIQKINEARVKNIMMELYADPIKNGVTLFLAEFLSKAICLIRGTIDKIRWCQNGYMRLLPHLGQALPNRAKPPA